MKIFLPLLISTYMAFTVIEAAGQQFVWAESYDVLNANEVKSLAVHSDGSIYAIGVFNAPNILPFTGNAYLLKTTPTGQSVWSETFTGSLRISDMAAFQNGVIITGQSNGSFSYQGQSYGDQGYYLVVMHIDHDGQLIWLHMDLTKFGGHANISVDVQNGIAVRTRGQGNIGDWILVFDYDGNIINSKQISSSETLIVDMAFHNGWIYLNGGYHGNDEGIMVDTIEIQRPGNDNVIFVLALNTELVASWVATDTTYLNRDGRIVVDDNGVYAYMEVVRTPFSFHNHLKKYTLEGQLTGEVDVPMYTTSVTIYPDMAITPDHVALFASNAFDYSSHKLMLFDHELTLQSEKLVNGLSHSYSGQVALHNTDLFIGHVFSGDLDFDGELTLPHLAEGRSPYIAKVAGSPVTGIGKFTGNSFELRAFPNPFFETVSFEFEIRSPSPVSIKVFNAVGEQVAFLSDGISAEGKHQMIWNAANLPSGLYFVRLIAGNEYADIKLIKQ